MLLPRERAENTSAGHAGLTPVHVVVLAAGRGSRLGALGETTPKWLLRVGDRTLAERHLEGILSAGSDVASVRVVVGHAAEAIVDLLGSRKAAVGVVDNPEWAERNNWWSLLRALRELPADGPVVVVNADLLVEPAALRAFLADAANGAQDAMVAVDLERRLTDESMKVTRSSEGTLGAIGKVGIEAPVGEYVGMLMARRSALAALRGELEAFVGRAECSNEWYEGAVGRTAAAGAAWRIWPMPAGGWVEIDDDDDLGAARALVGAA